MLRCSAARSTFGCPPSTRRPTYRSRSSILAMILRNAAKLRTIEERTRRHCVPCARAQRRVIFARPMSLDPDGPLAVAQCGAGAAPAGAELAAEGAVEPAGAAELAPGAGSCA